MMTTSVAQAGKFSNIFRVWTIKVVATLLGLFLYHLKTTVSHDPASDDVGITMLQFLHFTLQYIFAIKPSK